MKMLEWDNILHSNNIIDQHHIDLITVEIFE